ncbi:MAG: hypothetical protein GY927_22090 [bacterium]|nr:hypothetical protein [bacterium]
MLDVFFGERETGRLQRLPYLGYLVLFGVAFIAIALGSVLVIAGAEAIVGGDLQAAQKMLTERFGILAVIAAVLIGLVLFFVHLNLMGKRIRDIGLPAGRTLLAIVIVSILLPLAISEFVSLDASKIASKGFSSLIWFALLLIPSNSFSRQG